MLNTWAPDSHRRPKAQAILRDVNRILCDGKDVVTLTRYHGIAMAIQSPGGIFLSGLAPGSRELDLDPNIFRTSYMIV